MGRVWMSRLHMDDYSRVVQETAGGLLTVPDADGVCGNAKILRPRPDRCLDLTDSYLQADKNHKDSEMRLLNVMKTADMWNYCYAEHAKTTCTSARFEVHEERQIGLCWKQSFRFTHCDYHSQTIH